MSPTLAPAAMTVAQAAEYLTLSSSSVYRLIREGGLPAVRFGRSVRIPRVRLDEWLAGEATAMPTKPA